MQDSYISAKNVAVVVVTYNRKAVLRECLSALLAQCVKDIKLFVIDNASVDGTKEYISDLLDDTRIIYKNTGENLGGAGGFNFGIKEALKTDCDYVWLMDDDCIVGGDSLSSLLTYAKGIEDDFGFLSSVVRYKDGSVCNMNVQRKSIARAVSDFDSDQRIYMATFVSMLLNRRAVKECGLPIKEFFIWGDDLEYSSRISQKFKNYFVPSSAVIHNTDSNTGSDIIKDNARLDRYFYAYRNEKYFYDRLGLKGKLYFALKVAYHRLKILLFASLKKEKLAVIKKSLKSAKTFKPQIEFI